ncbi:MAG: hypothetical protein Q7S89_02625 [bacterium]|nr:hypothetical protein [bacterium]
MPESERKIGEVKVTITTKRVSDEKLSRELRVQRELARRRMEPHDTAPHTVGGKPSGQPSSPTQPPQPSKPPEGAKPSGQQPEGAPGQKPGAAPAEGKPPEGGKPEEGKEGEAPKEPPEEAPKGSEEEPEKSDSDTPEDRKKALDEQREQAKEDKKGIEGEEGEKKEEGEDEGEQKEEGKKEEKPSGRFGGALKRLKEAQKKRAVAKAAGGEVTNMSWQEFYQLVEGTETLSLIGIILAVFIIHVQVWVEFFSLDIEAIPPFEIPLLGKMFPLPLWMKMTFLFFFDFMLIIGVIAMLAPIFIPLMWSAKLFG